MACLPIPVLPLPGLPDGFSVAPPDLPPLPEPSGYCCVAIQFAVTLPPIPLPPLVLNAAFIGSLKSAIAIVQAYTDAIPLSCPKE